MALTSLKNLYEGGNHHNHSLETITTIEGGVDKENIDDLYKDSLIQQAVDVPVNDAVGNWITTSDNGLLNSLKPLLISAGINARKYGSAMIIPVIVTAENKRVNLTTSLDTLLGNPQEYKILKFVEILNFSVSETLEENILSDNYGKPSHYLINNNKIHSSRAFIIKSNNSGNSFILSIIYYWCSFRDRFNNVTTATDESNWIILKTDLKMLVEMAQATVKAGGGDNVEGIVSDLMKNRLTELRENANNNNAYGIDKETEDVEQVSKGNINQLNDAATSALELLTAAVDIPISRYLGKQAGGVGNSGDDPLYIQSLYGLRSFMFDDAITKAIYIITAFERIEPFDWEWNKTAIETMQCADCSEGVE